MACAGLQRNFAVPGGHSTEPRSLSHYTKKTLRASRVQRSGVNLALVGFLPHLTRRSSVRFPSMQRNFGWG